MDEMSSKQHETHPDRKIILIFGKKNLEILWTKFGSGCTALTIPLAVAFSTVRITNKWFALSYLIDKCYLNHRVLNSFVWSCKSILPLYFVGSCDLVWQTIVVINISLGKFNISCTSLTHCNALFPFLQLSILTMADLAFFKVNLLIWYKWKGLLIKWNRVRFQDRGQTHMTSYDSKWKS